MEKKLPGISSMPGNNLPGVLRDVLESILWRTSFATKSIGRSRLFAAAWYRHQYGQTSADEAVLIADYLSHAGDRAPHPLFDVAWYKASYPEVATSKLDPLVYFLRFGAQQGQSPTPFFDSEWYLANNEDVRLAGAPPFLHYLEHGWREGRNPHPLFDIAWYRDQLSSDEDGMDPLTHYVTEGWRLQLSPHPLFDPAFYRQTYREVAHENPLRDFLATGATRRTHFLFDPAWYLQNNRDVADAGLSALLHYLRSGWKEKRDPMLLFDAAWYLMTNPDVANAGVNPFIHYIRAGAVEKRSPHPLFDGKWYIERYADVRRSGVNPLLHYLCVGWTQERSPHPLFDVAWYSRQNPDLAQENLEPLQHYIESGLQDLLSPHPLFDAKWYLDRYQDVADAKVNPLRHYLTAGWRENRDPGPFFNTAWYRKFHDYREDDCPLSSYLSQPNPNLQSPHLLFDAQWYTQTYAKEIDPAANCYLDYVRDGIASGRIPTPYYERVVSLVGKVAGTPLDLARHVFTKALTTKGVAEDIQQAQQQHCGVLDTHYEIWKQPPPLDDRIVCLFVAYAPKGYLPRSTLYYLAALRRHGIVTILIAATPHSGMPYADEPFECDGIISRDNAGFDFASWALALNILPSIWRARTVIFTNDSIFGPTSEKAFHRLFDKLETSTADYLALTESWQVEHHYQSYFFALKRNALRNLGAKAFWRNVRSFRDKDQVIYRYELKMLHAMIHAGLQPEVLFPLDSIGAGVDANPTLDNWRDLLADGFPFLKVQVLRDELSGIERPDLEKESAVNPDLRMLIAERLGSQAEQGRKIKIQRFA